MRSERVAYRASLHHLLSLILVLLAGASGPGVAAQTSEPPASEPVRLEGSSALSYSDAFVLGLVEGITEYLPVSSTGHLILTNALLGLEDDRPLLTQGGERIWLKKPDSEGRGGVPMTLSAAAAAYVVIIQVGAIAAVVLLFWPYLWRMLLGLLGKDTQGLLLLRNIGLAVAPAVVFGLTLDDWIEERLFSVTTVVAALVVGSLIMFGIEAWRRRKGTPSGPGPELWDLNPKQALTVGFLQCFALWPGMSRSMMTIVGGYAAGLSPRRAAEFSFLVGLPTLAGASLLKGVKSGPAMLEVFGIGQVAFGFAVAAISAALAVRWLVGFLQRRGLTLFAWYRLALAAAVLIAVQLGLM